MRRERLIREQRERRALRVRKRLRGDAERPRLSVFRSHRHIYAQLIDDGTGRTLCASSSRVVCGAYGGTVEHAGKVGTDLAEKAKALAITKARFDRGRYRFHGRVKALAEAARKSGLEF
ncbi:MAG: 50S ribosomal protein L18 [Planctomycetes bacterium]|nr:50S ribosomal protein L18 [Planctomycetota bacterium]